MSSSTKPLSSPKGIRDSDGRFGNDDTSTTNVTALHVAIPERRDRNRATLTMVAGPDVGRVYSLGSEVTIGRSRQCTIALDDAGISRIHTRIITSTSGERILTDLGSRNGTFIDSVRVDKHVLRDGERVQVGPTVQLRYTVTDDDEERILRELYESSVRDPLTGAFNRKHFQERLQSELAFATRHRTELALLMLDIDHFKLVNDTIGHPGGDHVLRVVANLVARTIRTEDVFARYGGEEFTVIARGIGQEGALALGERIRSNLEATRIEFDGTTLRATVSIGVATVACCESSVSADAIVALADRRLYDAKHSGRNRVVGHR